ncbi:kinase-like protein [Martensiomyces pterosporus]|nr:kinase-like protein [Martensiomyces pterosporus]
MGREHQSRLLFVSLLENYCRAYDDDPLRNRRLFFAICRTLFSMGIIGKEYVDEVAGIRATYSEAFRQLVVRAQESLGRVSASSATTFESMVMDMQRSRYHDDFIQLRCLGRGGFGKVFEVRNKLDGRRYAVKQIKIKGEITADKTLREIKTLANLDHPNIVRYYSSWIEVTKLRRKPSSDGRDDSDDGVVFADNDDDGIVFTTLFVQMQLCQTTLQEYFTWIGIPDHDTLIDPILNIRLFRSIVEGVKYFHDRGVIHRDLKGANVFLDIVHSDSCGNPLSRGGSGLGRPGVDPAASRAPMYGSHAYSPPLVTFIPRIGDFGLATKSTLGIRTTGDEYAFVSGKDNGGAVGSRQGSPGDGRQTRRGSVCVSGCDPSRTSNVGTITYAAPEQLEDRASDYNEKADIYSLGIIFFELYYPFATAMERIVVIKDLRRGVFPPSFVHMWPKEAAFILWLMAADPERRPSAKEILNFDLIDVPSLESAHLRREVSLLKHQLKLANQRNEELSLRVTELERLVDMSI